MIPLARTWHSIWHFHRVLVGILVLEYALAFVIMASALGVLISRSEVIGETSGINEAGLYVVRDSGINQPVHRSDLFNARSMFATLAGEPQVAIGSSVPFFGRGALQMPISVPDDADRTDPMQVVAYEGDMHFFAVLGLKLLRGRMFLPDEIVLRYGDSSHVAMLSAGLASRLFHGQGAVGRQVKIGGEMHTVVGVMGPLAAPQYLGSRRTGYTLLLPRVPGRDSLLLVRYRGAIADLEQVLNALRKHDSGKVNWSLVPYESIRSDYFRSDRLMVVALTGIVCVVLVTALCGILGLTNYWISRRRPQIAIRRALGAKRLDIVVHFIGETALLVSSGMMLGATLYFLSRSFGASLHASFGIGAWVLSTLLVLLLALLVVFSSLRRWLRVEPARLMRLL